MRRNLVWSLLGAVITALELSAAAAGEMPRSLNAEPARLPTASIGHDFNVAPSQRITPVDPYEAYADPDDPPVARRRPVVVRASAEMPVDGLHSVMKAPQAPASAPLSVSQRLYGKVIAVDPSAGVVQIACPAGREPRFGQIVKITREYLFGHNEIGRLQIVRIGRGVALARPVGQLPFSRPTSGDVVDYWSVFTASAPPVQTRPALAAR
jgi:hypothetical protein